MKRVDRIRHEWRKYNDLEFGGKLKEPKFGIERRNKRIDGWFTYTNDWGNRRLTIHSEVFADKALFLATLLHEMIHQWELEVLEICADTADHKGPFAEKAAELIEKYKVPIV